MIKYISDCVLAVLYVHLADLVHFMQSRPVHSMALLIAACRPTKTISNFVEKYRKGKRTE